MTTVFEVPQQSATCQAPLRWHAGSLVRIVASSGDTGGEMSGVELVVTAGMEPPPHAHSREDEAVYVIRGDVEFTIGRARLLAGADSWVMLPRGVRHSYKVLSDDAHLLVMYTPGGIETFYEATSESAEDALMPLGTLSWKNVFDLEYLMELGRHFGLKFYPARPERYA